MLTAGASAWFWEAAAWRDEGRALVEMASRLGLRRLYVSVEIRGGVVRDLPLFTQFIVQAQARGVAIEIVEGDPRMIAGRGLVHAIERAEIVRASLLDRSDRLLAGVQYDIEPYVAGRWRGTAADCARWEDAVIALVNAVGEPVDLVLPYWLLDFAPATQMLGRLPRALRSVTVMAYRTSEQELLDIARRWAGWTGDLGIPLQLAVETGAGAPTVSFRGDLTLASRVMGKVLAKLDPANLPRLAIHGLAMG